MILIQIITNKRERAFEIADFLIEQNLLLDAVIDEEVLVRERDESGKFRTEIKTRVMGKTKGLLFETIDEKLQKMYPEDMPTLYSVPIVHMDWEQSNQLIQNTAKV